MIETKETTTMKLTNGFAFVKPNGKLSRTFSAPLYARNNAAKVYPAGTDLDSKIVEIIDGKPASN